MVSGVRMQHGVDVLPRAQRAGVQGQRKRHLVVVELRGDVECPPGVTRRMWLAQ